MLRHLHIENYALISSLDIDFREGFSVMTGETGAGKSIILGALALLMGSRADSKSITEGETKCVVEAEFDIKDNNLQTLFADNDIDFSENCIIRREVLTTGKSRAFINDTPVQLTLLKSITDSLVDIHSQHENLLLRDDAFQLSVIDSVADNGKELEEYSREYENYRSLTAQLAELKALAAKSKDDSDYIQFQYNQLLEARLQAGEETELEQQMQLLQHAEEIKSDLAAAAMLLDGETAGALSAIKEALHHLKHIDRFLPQELQLTERLDSAYIELRDIADEAARIGEDTDFNPALLQQTQERLDMLNSLMQKHRVNSTEELIALQDNLHEKLQRNESFDEEIAALELRIQTSLKTLADKAGILTGTRRKVLKTISEQLRLQLGKLGIAHANMDVVLSATEDFTPTGRDFAQFMFAANKNQSLRPVAEVASGGETARIMLCIKALTADKKGLPTIIFDEVDTGISGEVADNMGILMRQIAAGRQIIAITHLPQIASKGSAHYKVFKRDNDRRTETHIKLLTAEERITEIATLLSGENITEAALANASELMQQCNNATEEL